MRNTQKNITADRLSNLQIQHQKSGAKKIWGPLKYDKTNPNPAQSHV